MENPPRRPPWLKVLAVIASIATLLGVAAGLTVDLPEAAPRWRAWLARAIESYPAATAIATGIAILGLLLQILWPRTRAALLSRELNRAYLLEAVRPYDDAFIFPTQIWTDPDSTPAYSKRLRMELRAPQLREETKVLLTKVRGAESTADVADVRDLHKCIADVNPKLARKGLLLWREALLAQLKGKRPSSEFNVTDQTRQATIATLQMSIMERKNELPQLLFLLDMVHGVTIMTEAM